MMKRFCIPILLTLLLTQCSTVSENVEAEMTTDPLQHVDDLLSSLKEQPQLLLAPSDQVSRVTGSAGTVVHVDPDRLETVDGTPLGEQIQVELIELTERSSMMVYNTQTTSNGELLITGGAYYINMTSNGKQLKIKAGKEVEVEFPKLTEGDMELFIGERDGQGQMNWKPDGQLFRSGSSRDSIPPEPESQLPSKTAFIAPTKPTKPLQDDGQDDRVLTVSFDDSTMLPELQPYNNVSFRVNDDCAYDPSDADNFWYKVSIAKAKVDGEYIITFEGVEKDGSSIVKKYEVTPVLEGEDYQSALSKYEERYNAYVKTKAEMEAKRQAEIEKERIRIDLQKDMYATMKLLNFGWYNCDKFFNQTGPSSDIVLQFNNDSIEAARVFAVFDEINSIVTDQYVKRMNKEASFKKVPKGYDFKIIALAAHNGTPYMFKTAMTSQGDRTVAVNFTATSQEEIKDMVKTMNYAP